jgi:hypothetical protein
MKREIKSRSARVIAAAFFASSLGADCEGNVLSDPTFRDWCGDALCKWTTDSGTIQRVPTWNANDFGVSLVDSGTQISQVPDEVDATCLLFTTVANIDPAAQVMLSVDFDADGTVETLLPLGATAWHRIQLEITAPAAYRGIRFALRKDGAGAAVLAEMRVQSTTGCTGAAPILHDLATGQPCVGGPECESGVCSDASDVPSDASADASVAPGARCL